MVDDTRPISVANSDNRLVAKIVTDTLVPAFQAFIEGSQRGFVPGRIGTTNVEIFAENYYSRLDKKKQYYILFLDTKKAFDSLDHDFIIDVLRSVNLPDGLSMWWWAS